MRRWIPRTLSAAALGLSLAAAAPAQQPMPPAEPIPTPVAPPVVPPPPPAPPVAPLVAVDPYAAATPYNPTVVGRPVPNPHYNRAIYTIPCAIPNQNLDPLQPYPRRDIGGHWPESATAWAEGRQRAASEGGAMSQAIRPDAIYALG